MIRTILFACLSILLVASIIHSPDASFQASLQGLNIWWGFVFPGLLPFLVLFELLSAFGIAHGLGVLLQPMLRRLLRLPEESGLAVTRGWLGGFPAGAETVAELRTRGVAGRDQAQRLLALAHMPNPIFMLVVVGAGFLAEPWLGVFITAAVWISALWLAWLSALLSPRQTEERTSETLPPAIPAAAESPYHAAESIDTVHSPVAHIRPQSLVQQAVAAMEQARLQDGRSLGKLLGESVTSSIQKLMATGGLIIFCSVLTRLMLPLLETVVPSGETYRFVLAGLMESHLGSYAASSWHTQSSSSLLLAVAVICAIVSWSGGSALLGAANALSGTDLRLLPFIAAKLLHAAHAFMFAVIMWKPALALLATLPPALRPAAPTLAGSQGAQTAVLSLWPSALALLGAAAFLFLAITALAAPFRYRRTR
ncbi:nucleoside recognition domain-containing protein [Paenibacillus sp. GCM10023252]|uniref:nucleoside recognition domain-containing protein n=1 Tax=Paenibacillus sp. GCM10023252 TaxID=3252649 RepID=UPI0036074B74